MIKGNEIILSDKACDLYGYPHGQKGFITGDCNCGDENCSYKKVEIEEGMILDLEASEYTPAQFIHKLKQHPLTEIFK